MQMNAKQASAAGKEIARALKGLDQVTFMLDVTVHHWPGDKDLIRTEVTLWFGQHFDKRVSGGEDITWLAKECRRVALECLAKISEISSSLAEK
jgi:hypothetical protein